MVIHARTWLGHGVSRRTGARISIPRMALLLAFGCASFGAGVACQIYVDTQMPTVIIRPHYAPEAPPQPGPRLTIT